jgi:hypothetical protein
MLISVVRVKALVDTGAQFTCIRRDVVNDMSRRGLDAITEPCEIVCHGVEGSKCQIKETITLRCSVGPCTKRFQFKILDKGPYEAILGLGFLTETQMIVDAGHREYHFASAPSESRKFESQGGLQSEPDHRVTPGVLAREIEKEQRPRGAQGGPESSLREEIIRDYPMLFSGELGTAKGMQYEIDLIDTQPVRSRPYHCAPPKLAMLKEFVQDLERQGVVQASQSPYASPAFLLTKPDGGYRMVVDYRKVNKKIAFDAYPLPTLEQAFQHFAGAKVFSILDLNSAYYQVPLTKRSRKITAFCTPFGLWEFSKLPMGVRG